jgi:Flp pilus assembly protein CpaB
LIRTAAPRRSVVPGAISSPGELKDKVASQTTFAGEQVTARRFSSVAQTGISGQLKGTLRAFQISGDQNQLLAGTLKNGDFVDVVATWSTPDGSQHHSSKVIARNLKVLQAPAAPSGGGKLGSPNDQFYVQLRGSDASMQAIYYARKNGELSLLLRPPSDAQNSRREVDDWSTLLDRPSDEPLGNRVNR